MSKKRRKKHANNRIKTESRRAEQDNHLRDKPKISFGQVLSNQWVRGFCTAFVLIIIALGVAIGTATGVKAAALTFAAVGTVTLWVIAAAVIRYAGPQETEYHGFLRPAAEPMPPNPCGEIPANALAILLGTSAAYSSASPHAVIRIKGEPVLSFERAYGEIAINARVFSRDGRIVAEIRRNEFFINPNNYFRRERPDSHSLIVFDQENRRVLDVRFINPRALRFLGIFNHPTHEVVISESEGLFAGGTCFGENGTDVAFD